MIRRFWSLAATAFLSVLCLVASSQTAAASPFLLQTVVAANLGCVPEATCPEIDGDHDVNVQRPGPVSGGGFVSMTDATDGIADTHFTYSAAADASFGVLHARASGTYDLPSPSTRAAVAAAIATDLLTIDADGLAGQTGTLNITFLLEGTLNGGAAVFAGVSAGSNPDAFSNPGQAFDLLAVPPDPVVVPVSFVWGDPFYLSEALIVAAGTPVDCIVCNGGDLLLTPVAGTGSGTADFFSTLRLTGLQPFDAFGNPVLNPRFSSASGTTYSVDGVAVVPEPASLVLLGTGLAVAVRRRRRGDRSASDVA